MIYRFCLARRIHSTADSEKKKRRLILLCRGPFVCVGGLALLTIPGMRAPARAKSSHQNVALETKDSATAVQVDQGEPSWGEGFSV